MADEKDRIKELEAQKEALSVERKRIESAEEYRKIKAEAVTAEKELSSIISRRLDFEMKAKAAEEAGRTDTAIYNRSMQQQLEMQAEAKAAESEVAQERNLAYEVQNELQKKSLDQQEEALDEEIKLAKAAKERRDESVKTLNAYGAQLKKLVGIGKVMAAFSMASLIEGITKANSVTNTLSKQFGTSLESARGTREEYEAFAQTNNRVDFERLVKGQQELGKAIGQNIEYSKEMAEDFVEITEYMGLSTQTAGKLAQLGQTLGQSSAEFREGIADSLIPLNKSLGLNTNIKQLYEDIGNLSATTVINLGRQGGKMAEVTQLARRFGMEMQQIASFSQSLLNFESSITAELEAEVLIGKELNLERARMAALRGDEVTLAREMAQQVGSINEFEKMNVIQRESLAKAFGMNVEQMSTMLIRQEAMNQLGDKAKDATDAQLEAAKEMQRANGGSLASALEEVQKREDASKRFEDSMRKLKTILTDILSGLDPVIDNISKLIKSFTESPMFKTFAKIGIGLAAAGGIAKIVGSVTGALRGTRFMPMHVKMAGMPGMGAASTPGTGMFSSGAGMNYGQRMAASRAGTYGLSRGMGGAMGLGAGLGFAAGGALVQYAGNKFADKFEEEGNIAAAKTTDMVSGAGQGALYGAALGSIVPGIGTAAGAIVGGAVGLLTGALEASSRDAAAREEERKRSEEEKEKEFQKTLKDLAMREAKIYMDSNQVGLGLAQGNNYAVN